MQGVFLDRGSLDNDDLCLEPLHKTGGDWKIYDHTEPHEVLSRIKEADIIITNKVIITAEHIKATSHLKLICVAATGTNNVDLKACKAANICVCNAVGYGNASVVQHTFMLILMLATQVQGYIKDIQQGAWQKSAHFCLFNRPIMELSGKTLGVVGYGTLGQAVAHMAKAFGMHVIIAERKGKPLRAGRTPFESVLKMADVVTLHCPLTEETHHLIDSQALARMQSHALLINTARGGIVDELALMAALKKKTLAGAALDVLSQEPPSNDHPLLKTPISNLIITPHNAWATRESRQRLLDQVVENIASYLEGKPKRSL